MSAVMHALRRWICDWTHGGGQIKRDADGRINWQCNKCEAWADPVSLEDEQRMTDAHIRPCSCHPDDNPPVPCARKYAFSECVESMHVPATCTKNEEI